MQKKWPVPTGFSWSHVHDAYTNKDYQVWDSETNIIRDRNGDVVSPADPRHIEGGAPRILPADIEAAIKFENYYVDGTLTICVLTLQNDFKVTGESACAAPENFDAKKGEELARRAACEKIWPLLGYALRDRLHRQGA